MNINIAKILFNVDFCKSGHKYQRVHLYVGLTYKTLTLINNNNNNNLLLLLDSHNSRLLHPISTILVPS